MDQEVKLNKDLKKLLVSEINLIRDVFSVVMFFVEGAAKTGMQVLKDIGEDKK